MNRIFAQLMLWLIRPALQLQHDERKAEVLRGSAVAVDVAVERISRARELLAASSAE